MLKQIVKLFVSVGTTVTVSSITRSLQRTYVPNRTGAIGLLQDASLTAARYAITCKAADTMDKYVEERYDATALACKKALKAISDISKTTKTKNIDISTKEETTDGETNTEDHTEANAN
jgi:hypothetical protein